MKPGDKMQLCISSLSKQYRHDFWGIRDFYLELNSGIVGLLGPNGAGKSTLMRMLATITKPTNGSIHWNGSDVIKNPNSIRSVLGYLPQDFGIYPHLTGFEFLEYMAAIKGLDTNNSRKRINELLTLVNLVQTANRPLGGYSGGMKQRIGIAQALLNDPKLLIVDEPTVGLDPEERVRFRNLLSDLSGERLILLSTHIVSDIEAVATEIVVINQGQKIQHAAPEELLKIMNGKIWLWIVPSTELPTLKQKYLISGTLRHPEGMQVRVVSESSPSEDAQLVEPNLEDAYLYLVSQNRASK